MQYYLYVIPYVSLAQKSKFSSFKVLCLQFEHLRPTKKRPACNNFLLRISVVAIRNTHTHNVHFGSKENTPLVWANDSV